MIWPARLPLTTKIVLLTLLNLALLSVVFVIFVRFQLQDEFESYLMSTARERILAVSRLLALDLQQTPPDERTELLAQYSDTHGVTFLLADPDARIIAGPALNLPQEVAERIQRTFRRGPPFLPPPQRRVAPMGPPFLVQTSGPMRYWVGVRIPLRITPGSDPTRATVLVASRTFFTNPFFFQAEPWLAIGAVSLAVSLLCWLPMVRGLTRSIKQMMQATSRIAEGQFDVQIETSRQDELGSLGASINRMSKQLQSFVHGQKRFLGDIAHELRSPLGRMQLVLGILERRTAPDDTQVADLREEVETMAQLTDELLAFAKAELKPEAVALAPVDVAEAVQEAMRQEVKDASDIRVEIEPDLKALANHEYVVRAVANLIRNSIRYAGDAGPITVNGHRAQNEVVLTVADSGPGVPEDALDKIATPFFRLESSRNRRQGGTGLGLAIVRSCVEACRGSVIFRNRQPHGLEVTVRLPVA
jgi:two-component system sensor histidine kinase CpxA